jgi:hypothetical protein
MIGLVEGCLSGALTRVEERPQLDEYGGIAVKLTRPTGFFHTAKIKDRWMFIDPLGNPFWMLGIFHMGTVGSKLPLGPTNDEIVLQKYGNRATWASQMLARMDSWGFNTVAEESSDYFNPPRRPADSAKKPIVLILNTALYGLKNVGGFAPGPFKSLIDCQNPEVFRGWKGNAAPDVFDPNFALYVDGNVASHVGPGHPSSSNRFAGTWTDLANSPWLIGITTDDADYVQGFGSGPDLPTADGVITVHIGWLALAANPTQHASVKYDVTYADATVYAKKVLRNFLLEKYRGEISALNAAWRSHYTSFESAGGWGNGTGLMDEDGRNTAWLGKTDATLLGASPEVTADLNEFLYRYAKQYFSVTSSALHRNLPHALVWAPASMNGHSGVTRQPILKAAGEYVDVANAAISGQAALDLTVRYLGDKPIITWEGNTANPDSALSPFPNTKFRGVNRQEDRGRWYNERVKFLFNARSTSGTHSIAGLKFWDLYDSWAEKSNWGLVSFRDNPYDGKAAIRATGKDAWGYPTGGEDRDYGDFISAVEAANSRVLRSLNDFVVHADAAEDHKTDN